MALCTSNQQSDCTLEQSCANFHVCFDQNHPDDYKWVEFGPKQNYIRFKNSVFGLFIVSWSSYPYMYVGLVYNVHPTPTYPPYNAYHILTELSM